MRKYKRSGYQHNLNGSYGGHDGYGGRRIYNVIDTGFNMSNITRDDDIVYLYAKLKEKQDELENKEKNLNTLFHEVIKENNLQHSKSSDFFKKKSDLKEGIETMLSIDNTMLMEHLKIGDWDISATFDTIKNAFTDAFNKVKDWGEEMGNKIKNFFENAKNIISDKVSEWVKELVSFFDKAGDSIKNTFEEVWKFIEENAKMIGNKIKSVAELIGEETLKIISDPMQIPRLILGAIGAAIGSLIRHILFNVLHLDEAIFNPTVKQIFFWTGVFVATYITLVIYYRLTIPKTPTTKEILAIRHEAEMKRNQNLIK